MAGPLKVVFIGQRDWCDLCADAINSLEDARIGAAAFVIDKPAQVLSPRRLLSAAQADVIVRVGFRPGSNTRAGRGFEALWSLVCTANRHASIVYYWIGTDVSLALSQVASGASTRKMYDLARRASHYAGAEDLVHELAGIGITARHVVIPWTRFSFPEEVPPLPDHFQVLTYVPDARADFYGGQMILEAARALPEIHFLVMGGTGEWVGEAPDNIEFLGWVQEPGPLYRSCAVVARLVEHDGGGGTVYEALLYGRYVIYTRERPYCTHVPFGDKGALVDSLCTLLQLHHSGTLRPNTDGAAWARDHYSPAAVARTLADALLAVPRGRASG